MKHMTLEEWDKSVAPKLAAIKSRAVWIRVDANQIKDWVKSIPAVPEFETEAMDALMKATESLAEAGVAVAEAMELYLEKEKTT